jgi:hypothetical protein
VVDGRRLELPTSALRTRICVIKSANSRPMFADEVGM